MGIPRFFRYITERYPCINEVITEVKIPHFDNLYLDANGIIHQCSHPNDEVVLNMSEDELFESIFNYIEYLFLLIKPEKLLFIAVDGVAPRAKMNQQRGRRFRAAQELECKMKKIEEIVDESRIFDSNCISPGTEFMAHLDEYLRKTIAEKVSFSESWRRVKVYYSGHLTPGEGEHKIMEFIRFLRAQKDYDTKTRHCLYGLDADLITLGLVSHEPYFSLLREEVIFSKNAKRKSDPNNIKWLIFHLSLLREYINLEFECIKSLISFEYDIERIIDDWILIAFLAGNDFIPTVPGLYIGDGTLSVLWRYYKETLPTLNGYLNVNGELDVENFKKFIENLAQFDICSFKNSNAEYEWYENADINLEEYCCNNSGNSESVRRLEIELENGYESESDSSDEFVEMGLTSTQSLEFQANKSNYYRNKLHFTDLDVEVPKHCEEYFRALQWILKYYYTGCPCWDWYFPYHYAPYLTDLKTSSCVKYVFDAGKPFRPFEQLLAILPSASSSLLPGAFQSLVTSKSPICKFYPHDFEVDLNNKLCDYEAVVLIPFIDKDSLLKAIRSLESELTADEVKRNDVLPCLIFSYAATFSADGKHDMKYDVQQVDSFQISLDSVRFGILNPSYAKEKNLDFPLLHSVKFESALTNAKLCIFGNSTTRFDSMILKLYSDKTKVTRELAKKYIGKLICVDWPHYKIAKVISLSDVNTTYASSDGGCTLDVFQHDSFEKDVVNREIKFLQQRLMCRFGIDVSRPSILLNIVKLLGKWRYVGIDGELATADAFDEYESHVLIEPTCLDVDDFVIYDNDPIPSLEPDSIVFCLDQSHYGMSAKVKSISTDRTTANLIVHICPEPDFSAISSKIKDYEIEYFPAHAIAGMTGMPTWLVAKLTGSILLSSGNKTVSLGFNWKSNKHNTETPGYAKKINNYWNYSFKAKDVIAEFKEQFPEFISAISMYPDDDKPDIGCIWPNGNGLEQIEVMKKWIANCPTSRIPKVSSNATCLSSEVLEKLEFVVDSMSKKDKITEKICLPIKSIYIPSSSKFDVFSLSDSGFELFDRVVNVKIGIPVPLGLQGTITGFESDGLEVMFDEEFKFGRPVRSSSKKNRSYVLPFGYLINATLEKQSQMDNHGSVTEAESRSTAQSNNSLKNEVTAKNKKISILKPPKSTASQDSFQGNSNSYTRVSVKELFDSVSSANTTAVSKVTADSAVDTNDRNNSPDTYGALQDKLLTKCKPKFEFSVENGFVFCKMTATMNGHLETFVGLPSLSNEEAKRSVINVALQEINNLIADGYNIAEFTNISLAARSTPKANILEKRNAEVNRNNKPSHDAKYHRNKKPQNYTGQEDIPRWHRKSTQSLLKDNPAVPTTAEAPRPKTTNVTNSSGNSNATNSYPMQNCEYLYQWALANHLTPPLYEFNVTANNLIICDAIVTLGIMYKRFLGVPSITKESAADSAAFSALQYFRQSEMRAADVQPTIISPIIYSPDMLAPGYFVQPNVGQRLMYPYIPTPQYEIPYSYTTRTSIPVQPPQPAPAWIPKYGPHYPAEERVVDDQFNVLSSKDTANGSGIPFIPVQAIKRMATRTAKDVDTPPDVNTKLNDQFNINVDSSEPNRNLEEKSSSQNHGVSKEESDKDIPLNLTQDKSDCRAPDSRQKTHCNVACNFNFEPNKN